MRLFLLLLIPFNIYAVEATGLAKICDQIDKVSAFTTPLITSPYSTIQTTPSGPVYSVLKVTTSGNSVVTDFCTYYNRLRQLEGADKALLTADYFNKLTDQKFNNHISFMKDTMEMSTSVSNMNKMDSGTLAKMQMMAPRVNRYLGSVNEYYASNTDEEIEAFTGRGEQERRMRVIMNSTRESSKYKDLLRCDTEIKKDEEYAKSVATKQEEEDLLKNDINYLIEVFRDMGMKFSSDKTYKQYLIDLNNLTKNYVTYQTNLQSRSIKVTKKRTKTTKPTDPSEDPTEVYDSSESRDYQTFTIKTNDDYYSPFVKKYSKLWKDYVNSNFLSETKGFALGPSSQFQQKQKDYLFECRDSKIYNVAKEKKPDLFVMGDDPRKDRYLKETRDECVKTESKKINSKVDNLFAEYAEILKKSIEDSSKLRADIWTIDSYYNGTLRIVNSDTNKSGEIQDEVTCSKDLNLTTMEAIKLKQAQSDGNLRMALYEERSKRVYRKEQEAIKVKTDRENEQVKEDLSLESDKRTKHEIDITTRPYMKSGM